MSYDLTISNYSTDELFILLGIDNSYERTAENISNSSTDLYNKALEEDNEELALFFKNVQEKLLADIRKPTSITVIDNHDLKYTSRIVNVDSQYKEVIDVNNANTSDYVFVLTEPLEKMVGFFLYSVEIPYSWYTFDYAYGTSCINIDDTRYDISSGNYSPSELINELNSIFTDISLSLVTKTGKVTIENKTSNVRNIIFFDELYNTSGLENSKINSNLGWLLGFRKSSYTLDGNSKITSEGLIDTWGTRYITLAIDDFNNNKISKRLIGVSNPENVCDIPIYNQEYNLVKTGSKTNEFQIEQISTMKTLTNAQINTFNNIVNDRNSKSVTRILAPVTGDILAKIPIKNPVKWNLDNISIPIVEFSGPIQEAKRAYFGPVTVTRMRVTLQDDKGRILNLNGLDWSFTLITKHLYQNDVV